MLMVYQNGGRKGSKAASRVCELAASRQQLPSSTCMYSSTLAPNGTYVCSYPIIVTELVKNFKFP